MDSILESSKNYKIQYRKLKIKNRKVRERELTNTVLGALIDKRLFEYNKNDYLNNNKELAIDFLTIIECIKLRVEKLLNVNLYNIRNEITPDEDATLSSPPKIPKTQQLLMTNLSDKVYTEVKKTMEEENVVEKGVLETKFKFRKKLPKVVVLSIKNTTDDSPEEEEVFDVTKTATINPKRINFAAVVEEMKQKTTEELVGAKIEGDYNTYVDIMKEKLCDKNNNKGNIIIDSYDGAEHSKNHEKDRNIISFSSKMICSKTFVEGSGDAGSSNNILTWCNLSAKETFENMNAIVKDINMEKKDKRRAKF